jgi:hypothetical protein
MISRKVVTRKKPAKNWMIGALGDLAEAYRTTLNLSFNQVVVGSIPTGLTIKPLKNKKQLECS